MTKSTYVDTYYEGYESFEQFMDMLDRFPGVAARPCVVGGSLGLWSGRKTITQRRFDDLKSAIYACALTSYNVRIEQRGSNIFVTAYHHDGQNEFEIHVLNNKGINADPDEVNLFDRKYQLTLKDYIL